MKPRLITSREELLQVVRDRQDSINLSHEVLDFISGVQPGYSAKLLADPPIRGFGEMSLKAVLDALALRVALVVIVEDPDMAERMEGRWKPRKRPGVRRKALRCVDGDAQTVSAVSHPTKED
ncbi:hypothetical protein V1283_003300 [Bradyrhizobium sp. AZCC 2262]|uniref:hypothetical protein n=1 Tax=Bradyrhizobium sp. AZCC 2262 TaxID=3117022 RepID=UPI002FF1AB8E